jgi:peptide deformylase
VDPATLHIVHYPADVLRQRAADVPAVTDSVRAVARRMLELMHEAEGIGLAAPQVGLPWRLFVVQIDPDDSAPPETNPAEPPSFTRGPEVYINPILTDPLGPPVAGPEGCLSLPDIRGDVLRPPVITIEFTDLEGQRRRKTASGLLARCWQHEYDHLEGVLIIDRFSPIQRIKNRSALRDLEQHAQPPRPRR